MPARLGSESAGALCEVMVMLEVVIEPVVMWVVVMAEVEVEVGVVGM